MPGLHCGVRAFSSCAVWASRGAGFSCCAAWALEPRLIVVAHQLSCLVTGASSQTRDQTCVPSIGMQMLNHLNHQNSPPEVFFNLEVSLLKIGLNYLISLDICMCKAL